MIRIELSLHHQEKNNHVRLLCHFCHVCAPFSFSLSTCSPVNEGDQDLSQDSNSILGRSNDWGKLEAESHLSFDKSTSLTELESFTFSAWKVRAPLSLSLINEPTLELCKLHPLHQLQCCQIFLSFLPLHRIVYHWHQKHFQTLHPVVFFLEVNTFPFYMILHHSEKVQQVSRQDKTMDSSS